jgi:hypothetical protein
MHARRRGKRCRRYRAKDLEDMECLTLFTASAETPQRKAFPLAKKSAASSPFVILACIHDV